MKTAITNQENNLTKLIKVLGIGALISLGSDANSQCIAQYTYNNDTVNNGEVFFTNASTIGNSQLTYSWDFGDGTFSNLENPNHIFTNTGTSSIIVCLTVADANGITCTFCDSIFTESQPIGGCQAFFYFSSDSNSVNSINFLNYSAGTPTNFFWDFGDNTTSTLEHPNHVYANAGTYQVCLTISDSSNSCQNSYCSGITIGNLNGSGCQANFSSNNDSTQVNGITFIPDSIGTGMNLNYSWDFGDGTTTSNLNNPNHIYADTGSYYACLTITDSNGGTCTYCDSVIAKNLLLARIIDARNINMAFENYPNPFSGSTTINYSISKAAAVELTILDLMGNKIATVENGNKSAGKYSTLWNAENASKGMYLLELKVNNQNCLSALDMLSFIVL